MTTPVLRFSDFEVDVQLRELRKAGARVRLQDQPFQILAMLLARPGEVVTRDEIRDRLWPEGTFVDFEHSVNAAIKRLRAALGDTAENPRFVETLHRRGYRFMGVIDQVAAPAASAPVVGTRRPRLVVLPFSNLSDDTPDYFSDGLTEELIAQLGRRCGNRLGVLARTSAMHYKNAVQTAGDIGEALRADYLVEGSVRRDGSRVRITAQLIETRGETHLWAESYDRRLEDCLAVQTAVATEIAHALAGELMLAPSLGDVERKNPAAYQAYLRARYHWNRPGDQGLEEAIAAYDEAIALEPRCLKAYSGRARARVALVDYYWLEPLTALEAARADAYRALEIDPEDVEAHIALGEVLRTLDWDWTGAEACYRNALTCNSNSDAAHRYYGVFLATRGRPDAIAMAERACDLDPLCLTANASAALVQYLRGDYATAIRRYRHTLGMDPLFGPARRGLAASLLQAGECREAVDTLRSLPAANLDPVSCAWLGHALAASGERAAAERIAHELVTHPQRRFVPTYHLALLFAGLGDLNAAFAALQRALEARDPSLDMLAVDPRFAALRHDSRYRGIVSRLRLEPTVA